MFIQHNTAQLCHSLHFFLSCYTTITLLPSFSSHLLFNLFPPIYCFCLHLLLSLYSYYFLVPELGFLSCDQGTMKKMKGVLSESVPQYGTVSQDDAKMRIKHQNLMQDYVNLRRETEAKRNKLLSTKQKKMTLMAEVRFLKRRLEQLTQNQTKQTRLGQPSVHARQYPPPRPVAQSKNVKPRSYVKKDAVLRPHMKNDDYVHRQRLYNGEESSSLRNPAQKVELSFIKRNPNWYVTSVRNPYQSFDHNQIGRLYNGTEVGLTHPSHVPDLNHKGRFYDVTEGGLKRPYPVLDSNQMIAKRNDAARRNPIPAFDLNQVLGEEEENQVPTKGEEPPKVLISGITDDQQNDMNLVTCRNLDGNGVKRVGKRKISWQDQVALRV